MDCWRLGDRAWVAASIDQPQVAPSSSLTIEAGWSVVEAVL
ncbi:hypothetical protein [Synechococcus sp. A18-25c]|nr:hypothetical protein [Synechococcus sp. A18-25c]MEC7896186.1 hypothetical protein [Cyanobacteriota bacterium]